MIVINLYNELKYNYSSLLNNHTTPEIDKKIAQVKERYLKLELPLTALKLQAKILSREQNLEEDLTQLLRSELWFLHCSTACIGLEQRLFPLMFSLGSDAVSKSEIVEMAGIDYAQVQKLSKNYKAYFRQFMKYAPLLLKKDFLVFSISIERQLNALKTQLDRFFNNNLLIRVKKLESEISSLVNTQKDLEHQLADLDKEMNDILTGGTYIPYSDNNIKVTLIFQLETFHAALLKKTNPNTADNYATKIREKFVSNGVLKLNDLNDMGNANRYMIASLFYQEDKKATRLPILKGTKGYIEDELDKCKKDIQNGRIKLTGVHKYTYEAYADAVKEYDVLMACYEQVQMLMSKIKHT